MLSRILVAVMVVMVAGAGIALAAPIGTVYLEDFEAPDVVGSPPGPTAGPGPYWVDKNVGGIFAEPKIHQGVASHPSQFYQVDRRADGKSYGAGQRWYFTTRDDMPEIVEIQFDVQGRGTSQAGRPLNVFLADSDGGWGVAGVQFGQTANTINIYDRGGTNDLYVAEWPEQVWQHVAMTIDTTTQTISVSVDGAAAVTTTYTPEGAPHPVGDYVWIGRTTKYSEQYRLDNLQLTVLDAVRTPGDADLNGVVNDADLSLLLAHWGQDVTGEADGGWGKGEFDATAPVQDNDLSLLLANWSGAGGAPPVPEPATLVLLAVAACMLRGTRTASQARRS